MRYGALSAMETKIGKVIALVCKEPYRLFFPLGILLGTLGAGHWLFYALGWISSYSGFFHALFQMQVYMNCFVTGFLLTAIPRFSATSPASGVELVSFLTLTLAVTGFLTFHQWLLAEASFIGWLLALARFVIVRIRSRLRTLSERGPQEAAGGSPPVEFIWIPIAIFHGIVGALLLIGIELKVLPPSFQDVGEDLTGEGFMLAMVAGVGGFLAPRLMGLFEKIQSTEICSVEERLSRQRRRFGFYLAAGLLLFLSFWFEGGSLETWASALRALVVTSVLVLTRSFPRLPRVPDFFAKLLWLAMGMVVAGSWLAFFFPKHEKTMLHFMFIGGFSLMTFAVATVVTLSHAGEGERLRRPLAVLKIVAVGALSALTLRVASSFFPAHYFNLLAFAAISWILAAMSWLFFVLPRLWRFPPGGEFERFHEQAKQGIPPQ